MFGLHGASSLPWVLLVLSFLSGALVFGQIPVIDAFAIRSARGGAFSFGPVRAFGSAMFIVANFTAGFLIDRLGTQSILAWLILAAGLLALAAAWLPEGRREEAHAPGKGDIGRLLVMLAGPLGLALLASAMVQAGHGFYYAFSAKAWSEQGFSGTAIGALWASGVVVEIAFLWLSGKGLLGRASPAVLLGVGAVGSVVRWGLTALSPPLLGALHPAEPARPDLCCDLCRFPAFCGGQCTRRACGPGAGAQLGPVGRSGDGSGFGRVRLFLCPAGRGAGSRS